MLAFWTGSVLVATGVALHMPMLLMGRHTGWHLAGMALQHFQDV